MMPTTPAQVWVDGLNVAKTAIHSFFGQFLDLSSNVTLKADAVQASNGTPAIEIDSSGGVTFSATYLGAVSGTNSWSAGASQYSGTHYNDYNTISGVGAGHANTDNSQSYYGDGNVAYGAYALSENTTGAYNVANGYDALRLNTSGNNNVANGYSALRSNTTGTSNVANGMNALRFNTTGGYNVANGSSALYATTTGGYNVASGNEALRYNTTGGYNVANGASSLRFNTTGNYNVGSGFEALKNCTTGAGNLAEASYTAAGAYSPVFNVTTEDNRVVIGHTSVSNAYVQVAWTITSDMRDKTDISDNVPGLELVNILRPVRYKYRVSRDSDEAHGRYRYGFLAQEVLAAECDSPVIVDDDDSERLRYNGESTVAVLVKAVQELSQRLDAAEKKIQELAL